MGGENSMVSWVDETPPLANKDYTHVNFRGAHRIAELLFTYLMSEYAHPTAPASPAAAAPTGPDSSAQPATSLAPASAATR
jgi:hypothetical protein